MSQMEYGWKDTKVDANQGLPNEVHQVQVQKNGRFHQGLDGGLDCPSLKELRKYQPIITPGPRLSHGGTLQY